jgi:hypothetical protein
VKARAGLAATATALLLMVASSSAGPSRPLAPPITGRSFTINAEAYPEAPVPGRGGTELGTRPLASRVAISNAPAAAYGRAALSDNGTIELYTGPPPEGTVAECDTTSPNIPDDADVRPGSAHLAATCTNAPTATAAADGMASDGSSSSSSRATGDGSGDAVVATASAAANDVVVGPFHIGSARAEASASTNGTVEGAQGSGHVEVSDATVAGVPVTIGPEGVTVDQSKVPVELAGAASNAVSEAMSQGGYLRVRVAQPEVTIAPDGSSVVVRGGGVFFEGATNDPSQPYFLRETLVGGSLTVAVGADLATAAVADAPAATAPDPVTADQTARPSGPSATTPSGTAAPQVPAANALAPQLLAQHTVRHAASSRLGWLWFVALAAALAVGATAFRRRLAPLWDDVADRYLRG